MRAFQRTLALLALVSLAACGGGSSNSGITPPAGSPQSAGKSAKATFVIKIPAKSTTAASASRRGPKYLTSAVQGVQISVAPAPGPTPGTGTPTPAPSVAGTAFYALTQQSQYCTGGGTQALVCTLPLQAPPGNDVFTVSTYDAPNYNSDIISTGTLTTQISAQSTNTINIATSGIVAQIYAGIDNTHPATGTPTALPIRAVAADADNNIIVGSFDMPLSVSDSDTTGATTLSSKSIAGSSDLANLSVTYNGNSLSNASFTIATTSPNTANYYGPVSAQVSIAPGTLGLVVSPSLLVFSSTSAASQTATVSGGPGSNFTFNSGCSGVAPVTGSGPTFTVAPIGTGGCQTNATDGVVTGTLHVFVQ